MHLFFYIAIISVLVTKPIKNFFHNGLDMERAMGIEPTWPAWKAGALPLSYARLTAAVESPKLRLMPFPPALL